MKHSLSILFAIAFCIGLASLVPLDLLPPSDIEVGAREPEDYLLSGFDVVRTEPGLFLVSGPFNFTYLSVTQTNPNHTDATSQLIEGGPGYDSFLVQLNPGPSGAFRYEVRGYGFRTSRNGKMGKGTVEDMTMIEERK